MNFKTNIPQIASLRKRVEGALGFVPSTHIHFVEMMDIIEKRLKEHVSETTLERVWGYSTRGYDSVSMRTLTVLSKLVGCEDWNAFCRTLHEADHAESEIFKAEAICSSQLSVGARLRIAWMPDRVCEIRYLGDNRFVAERTENSSIQPGDSFSCLVFQKGRELYMDHFCRSGETPTENARYVVGQRNGLTTLEIIHEMVSMNVFYD